MINQKEIQDSLKQQRQDPNDPQTVVRELRSKIEWAKNNGGHIKLLDTRGIKIPKNETIEVEGDEAHPLVLNRVEIQSDAKFYLSFCEIHLLTLANEYDVELSTCKIGTFKPNGAQINSTVTFDGCTVAKANFRGACLHAIRFKNQTVFVRAYFEGSPGKDPLVTGPFNPDGLVLEHREGLRSAIQNYRAIGSSLMQHGNLPAAGRFHKVALIGERQEEDPSKFNKLLSWLYQLTSDFGNSPGQVFWIWMSIAGVMIGTLMCADAGTLAEGERSLAGWRESLQDKTLRGAFFRAVYLTTQNWFVPLGPFGGADLVVAKSQYLAFVLGALRVFSAALIALFILTIRRRFKIL